MNILNKIIFLILLAGLASSVSAKQFYRFKNAEGNIIIKDQVTNEMIALGYDIINDNGQVISRVGPGKTLQELEEERLEKVEQRKAEMALKQQIRSDSDLLRLFSSIGDIIRTRDSQLLGLEQRIRIQGSKSELLKLQLEDQQAQAAIYERQGQNVPPAILKDIEATQLQIEDNYRNSVILEEEKIEVAKRYEKDIVRYKELESMRMTLKKQEAKTDYSRPVIYDCPDLDTCQKAWQLAQIYAKDNASGEIEIITNTLILTSKPTKDADLAISFSRIPAPNNGNQIVLEVSCNDSDLGAELCRSEQVKNLRKNYLTTIERRLN
jgi:hypothetical protein